MYDISKNRYRELKYFCLQYKEILDNIKRLRSQGIKEDYDPTANIAVPLADYINASRLIEKTAFDTDREFGDVILKSVTEDVPLSAITMPCSKDRIDDLRYKFFYLLSERKGL